MSKYWIAVLSEDNYYITVDRSELALSNRYMSAIKRLSIGDMVTFYIGKKFAGSTAPGHQLSILKGLARVSGGPKTEETVAWKPRGDEIFPNRISIEFINSNCSVPIRQIVPQLHFIKNRDRWGLNFLTGIREINAEDFHTIKKSMET